MVRDSTKSIHGHGLIDDFGSVVPPIYLSAVYWYLDEENSIKSDRGLIIKYAREENPTLRFLERVIAKLEDGEDSLAFSSGMAAISTVTMRFTSSNVKVVVPWESYSTTLQLFERMAEKLGFKLVRVWPSAESIIEAVDRDVGLVFLEVMTNPTLKILDLRKICEEVDLDRVVLVVDNTFTTPVILKPLKFGVRIVVHSTTKYLAGHNDVVGGALVGSKSDVRELWDWRRIVGCIQQPFEAYLTLRGLKTLEVRFERVSKSALEVAEFLSEHPRVEEVYYPGLTTSPYHGIASKLFSKPLYGGVLSFKVKSSRRDALSFLRRLKIIKPTPSLGGTESLISIASAAAAKYIPLEVRARLGISDNLLRLSVGLEDVEDLIEDLDRALS